MTFTRSVVPAALASSLLALGAGCAMTSTSPPGMREAPLRERPAEAPLPERAPVEGKEDERPLLVVYPRDA